MSENSARCTILVGVPFLDSTRLVGFALIPYFDTAQRIRKDCSNHIVKSWRQLPETQKRRLIIAFLVTVAGGFVCGLLGLEWYAGQKYEKKRDASFWAFQWDPDTLWKFKPYFRGVLYDQQIRINPQGLRSDHRFSSEPDRAIRILSLGDSRTLGFHLKSFETYSHALETALNAQGFDSEVINAGVHGYSALQVCAHFEQLLDLRPHIAVFTAGYNDRRYLIIRPPDNPQTFESIVTRRRLLDFFLRSDLVFAFTYHTGRARVRAIRTNPPPLDQLQVRISRDHFAEQIHRFVAICRNHDILPVLLFLPQNPEIYGPIEQALDLVQRDQHRSAITLIESALPAITDFGKPLAYYTLGRCYEALGQLDKAHACYLNHKPSVTMFGEGLLRSQKSYFQTMQRIASEEKIPFIDGEQVLLAQLEAIGKSADALPEFFMDDCHFKAPANALFGEALAEALIESPEVHLSVSID